MQDDDRREIILRPEGVGYVAELHYADGSSSLIVDDPIPMEYCQGCAEDYARRNLKIAFADANAGWMNEHTPATSGQRIYLEKVNAWQDGMTKAAASIEIRRIIAYKNKQRRAMASEPITSAQKWFLDNAGINTDGMSKMIAMREISRLKQKVS